MIVEKITDVIPLTTDEDGVIRVGGTRVPLETVIWSFEQGAAAEQIVYQFPVLKLADVYAVIAYYLNHREQVDDYMKRVEVEEEQMRQFVDEHFDQKGIRQRLLARQVKN